MQEQHNGIERFLEKEDIEIVSRYEFNGQEALVVVDPDGRRVEIIGK